MAVIECESNWNTQVQSTFRYNERNAPQGYEAGDQEESYGLMQIHIPVHDVTKEQALDPIWAMEWSAQQFSAGNQHWWSCYSQLLAKK